MTHQTGVGFGSPLDRSRLTTAGPGRHQIGRQDTEQFFLQMAAAMLGSGLQESLTIATCCSQVAGEVALGPAPVTVFDDQTGTGGQNEIARLVFDELDVANFFDVVLLAKLVS